MLRELNDYENLGTPKFFCELFNQLRDAKEPWSTNDVRKYFYNRVIDGYTIFDGCLSLAENVGAIVISHEGIITLNPSLESSLASEKYLSTKLLEMILSSVKEDDIFHEIFCSENISYDIIYRLIQIDGSAFRFRYTNFRRLLIDFNFLYLHPDKNIRKLILNTKYKIFFDKEIMPEIKKRKIGINELEKSLEQKQIYGKEAEAFVLEYEKIRLATHPNVNLIEIISEYDVAAGYDIISYKDTDSPEYNRFIEVKSYSGIPNFHWSKNEIDVARIKKDSYFIYLVNRDEAKNLNYIPDIIQNPYEGVFNEDSEWVKQVDSYFIIKK